MTRRLTVILLFISLFEERLLGSTYDRPARRHLSCETHSTHGSFDHQGRFLQRCQSSYGLADPLIDHLPPLEPRTPLGLHLLRGSPS